MECYDGLPIRPREHRPMQHRFPTRIPEAQLAAALAESTDAPSPALRALPKADVHCHALLNCPLATYEAVLGHALPLPPPRFRDFGEFGGYLAANLFPAIGSAWLQTLFAIVTEERDRIAERLLFAPEIGINRRVPPERLWPIFVEYIESGVFWSVDLYDDERSGDLRELQRFYRLARERGLLLKAHAGEICGAEHVRETVETLDVDVIQHGISATTDPQLLAQLARRGTQLNLCITSNIALGVSGSYEHHPIRSLLAAGVNVALGTDDFTLFGAGLCDELLRLRRAGMRLADLAKLRLGPPADCVPKS
jgi:Adenosine deaminase